MLLRHRLDADIIGPRLLPGLCGAQNGEVWKLHDLRDTGFKKLIAVEQQALLLPAELMQPVFGRKERRLAGERPSVPVHHTNHPMLILIKIHHNTILPFSMLELDVVPMADITTRSRSARSLIRIG